MFCCRSGKQGNGLGKLIMSEINAYLENNIPKNSYVSLIADVPADELYKKFGFEYSAPKSVGMVKKIILFKLRTLYQ